MTDNAVNDVTRPQGTLALQTFSMPKDTNANGDILVAGWYRKWTSRRALAASANARAARLRSPLQKLTS